MGAAVVWARRAGTTATFDQLNKYFLHGEMPIASSRYWNMVHGNTAEEMMKDEEGLQTMRVLGRRSTSGRLPKQEHGFPYPCHRP